MKRSSARIRPLLERMRDRQVQRDLDRRRERSLAAASRLGATARWSDLGAELNVDLLLGELLADRTGKWVALEAPEVWKIIIPRHPRRRCGSPPPRSHRPGLLGRRQRAAPPVEGRSRRLQLVPASGRCPVRRPGAQRAPRTEGRPKAAAQTGGGVGRPHSPGAWLHHVVGARGAVPPSLCDDVPTSASALPSTPGCVLSAAPDVLSLMTNSITIEDSGSPRSTARYASPRERALLSSIDSLSDAELLSVLLTGGGGAPSPASRPRSSTSTVGWVALLVWASASWPSTAASVPPKPSVLLPPSNSGAGPYRRPLTKRLHGCPTGAQWPPGRHPGSRRSTTRNSGR